MKFRAQLQAMAASEILKMIPPFLIEDIKRRDPNPTFKVYTIGHEGECKATWVGMGKIAKTWFKDAIGKLSRKLWAGMPIYHGHSSTNNPEGREKIGEVAGTKTQEIDGKFSAIMAAYIFPEYSNLPLDVASVEAIVDISDPEGEIHAVDVDDVEAVALGSSLIDTPGFPDATLLGAIQAFVDEKKTRKGDEMTLKEVKKLIIDEELTPSDLFSKKELRADPYIAEYVEKSEATAKSEFDHRDRTDKKFDQTRDEWEEKEKGYKEKIAKLEAKEAKTKARELLGTKAKERKLEKNQIKYIERKWDKEFEIEDPESTDREVEKFIDKGLDAFKEDEKIFNGKSSGKDGEKDDKTDDDTTPGGEPGDDKGGGDASHIPD